MIFVHHSPLAPLRCTTCDGYGQVRGESLCPTGCSCGGRYHGFDDGVCPNPRCDGGVLMCAVCQDWPALGPDDDGEEVCGLCLEAEAEEKRLEEYRKSSLIQVV